MRAVVGIDVGGSSTKTSIHSLDGTPLGVASSSYRPTQPAQGAVEYDPAVIAEAVEDSMREALRLSSISPASIIAITADAMISGTVGLDGAGHPTTPYTTTLDTRFMPELNAMVSDHGALIRELVGSSSPVVAAKIAWHQRSEPASFRRTSVFVTAGGFVGAHLAGLGAAEAFIDPTVLWAVGLSDTRQRRWSSELIDLLGVPSGLLPRIVESTTIVGGLTPEVAKRTGMRSGTPIIAGCGDQVAGFLGANVIEDGSVGDSAGTYEVVGRGVADFLSDPLGLFDIVPSAVGAGYIQQSVIAVGGGFTREWFQSKIAADWSSGMMLDLDELAEGIEEGSNGLIFMPHLGGQSSPSRPWLRGGWLGLDWGHHKGHLARSMMEATAFELASCVDSLGVGIMSVHPAQRIVGYGGGARSAVSGQIKADVLGIPYQSLGDIAPAGFAAAMLGGIAVGAIDDLQPAVESRTRVVRTFTPDPESTARYSPLRRDYAEAVELASQFRRPSRAEFQSSTNTANLRTNHD